jgi:hypothetical protein
VPLLDPFDVRLAAVSATKLMATLTAATVDPAATRSICPTSTRESSGGTQLSIAMSAMSGRILPEGWVLVALRAFSSDETEMTVIPFSLASRATSIGAALRPPCEKTSMQSRGSRGKLCRKTSA